MATSFNRALVSRATARVRSGLELDRHTGLPRLRGLTAADLRGLCDVGGGRLAVVTIRLGSRTSDEVAHRVLAQVRRTDLLGEVQADVLAVLAPGVDGQDGASLLGRLHLLLDDPTAQLGVAYRSALSAEDWSPHTLLAEASSTPANPT